jgi:hypothetical protein
MFINNEGDKSLQSMIGGRTGLLMAGMGVLKAGNSPGLFPFTGTQACVWRNSR